MCSGSAPWECTPQGFILGEAGDQAEGAVTDAAAAAGESAFDKFVESMVESAEWTVEQIMTLWMRAPDPKVTGSDSPAAWVDAHVSYLVVVTMVATLIYSGIRIAVYARSSEAVNLAETLIRTVLTVALAGTLIAAGLELSDQWSDWILAQADLDLSVEILAGAKMAQGFVLIAALVVILTQMIQLFFMIARNAIVMILAGTVSLAAAGSGTQMGRQAFQKQVSWLVALILYKPAAALIYSLSFVMVSANDLWEQLSGILLMILSVFALPALQRLVAPAVSAIGGANAGSLAGATVGAGIALGAMAATGGAAALGGAGGFLGAGGGSGAGGAAGGALAAGGAAGGSGPSGAAGTGASGSSPSKTAPSGGTARDTGSSGSDPVSAVAGEASSGPQGAADTLSSTSEPETASTARGGVPGASPSGATSDPGSPSQAAPQPPAGSNVSAPSGASGATSTPGSGSGVARGMHNVADGRHRLQSEADGVVDDGPTGAGRSDNA